MKYISKQKMLMLSLCCAVSHAAFGSQEYGKDEHKFARDLDQPRTITASTCTVRQPTRNSSDIGRFVTFEDSASAFHLSHEDKSHGIFTHPILRKYVKKRMLEVTSDTYAFLHEHATNILFEGYFNRFDGGVVVKWHASHGLSPEKLVELVNTFQKIKKFSLSIEWDAPASDHPAFVEWLSNAVQGFTYLEELSLNDCQLTQEAAKDLVDSINSDTHLKLFTVQQNEGICFEQPWSLAFKEQFPAASLKLNGVFYEEIFRRLGSTLPMEASSNPLHATALPESMSWLAGEHEFTTLYQRTLAENGGYALQSLEAAANLKNPLAQAFLSRLLSAGEGSLAPNQLRAMTLANDALKKLRDSADQEQCGGTVYALLGELYESGRGIPGGAHKDTAVMYYTKAAIQGCDEAKVWMGALLWSGDEALGQPKSPEEALRMYTSAADQGNLKAISFLEERAEEDTHFALQQAMGIRFEEGKGVTKNDEKAMYYYARAITHTIVSPESLYRLANLRKKYQQPDEAATLYNRLIEFPSTEYTAEARAQLNHLCESGNAYAFYYRAHQRQQEGKEEGLLADLEHASEGESIHPEARYDLAQFYEHLTRLDDASDVYDSLVNITNAKAQEALQRLGQATPPHARSLFHLAHRLLNETSVQKDQQQAALVLLKGAEKESIEACYALARLYDTGAEYIEPNKDEAAHRYYTLVKDKDGNRDKEKEAIRLSFTHLKALSEAGNKEALYHMAHLYEHKEDLKDLAYAAKIYHTFVDGGDDTKQKDLDRLCEANDTHALLYRGNFFEKTGQLIQASVDYEAAAKDTNHPGALHALARFLDQGGTDNEHIRDRDRAASLYNQLITLKYQTEEGQETLDEALRRLSDHEKNITAQFLLGTRYESHDEGIRYYMDAALQGHAVAQNKLGVYFLKQGNQASDEKAAQLLTAASKSHAASRYNLGLLYLHGRGVEQNTEKAKALFESIVQTLPQEQAFVDHIGLESTKLHTQAFLHLGLLLLNTEGEQHLPRAIDYISAAVVGEDRCAQRILGFLTLLGLGVEQSRNEGYLLLRKAAAQNDSLAHLGVALLNSNVDLSVILKENNLLTIISQASSQAVFL